MHIGIISLFSCRLFDSSLELRHGGAEVQIITLAKALAGRGHKVSVFVFDLGQGEKEIDGLRVIPCIKYQPDASPLRQIWEQRKLWNALKAHKPGHLLMPGGTGILALLTAYGKCHKAEIYSVLMHNRDVAGVPLLKGIDCLGFKLGLKNCHGVIAQNTVQLEAVKNLRAPSCIIAPPIESVLFKDSIKKNIVWAGRCVHWKQPLLFIQLAKEHREINFNMLLSEQDEELLQQIKVEAGTATNVNLIIGSSREEVLAHLSEAQLLISTSVSEGFPTVFLEAMTQSCAILSLNSNPDDVLNKSGAGKAFNNSLEKLSAELKQCLSDEHRLTQMQDAGKEYVAENHSPDEIAAMYEGFLDYEK